MQLGQSEHLRVLAQHRADDGGKRPRRRKDEKRAGNCRFVRQAVARIARLARHGAAPRRGKAHRSGSVDGVRAHVLKVVAGAGAQPVVFEVGLTVSARMSQQMDEAHGWKHFTDAFI